MRTDETSIRAADAQGIEFAQGRTRDPAVPRNGLEALQ
jgi:hypothetical protein